MAWPKGVQRHGEVVHGKLLINGVEHNLEKGHAVSLTWLWGGLDGT